MTSPAASATAGGPGSTRFDDWVGSGAAWLSGHPGGPVLAAPPDVIPLVRLAVADFTDATPGWLDGREPRDLDGFGLLGERAALAGLRRQGRRSCGGGSRLLECGDGWIAITLSRPTDLDAVPAWCGLLDLAPLAAAADIGSPRWESAFAERTVDDVVGAGSLLGLAVAGLGEQMERDPVRWSGRRRGPQRLRRPRIVDLSALWAGPLCAGLLADAGAEVVKVESVGRPDGLRADRTGFFDVLNGSKRSVALDVSTSAGVTDLRRLLESADVVVESSRPRALQQLGISADEMVAAGAPALWLSITAHGRADGAGRRIGFGDDAAVAGGLVAWDADCRPCFLGDALADPLSGLVAAGAVASAWLAGDEGVIDVALSRVAAAAAGGLNAVPSAAFDESQVARPRHRSVDRVAPPLGAHSDQVLGTVRDRSTVPGMGDVQLSGGGWRRSRCARASSSPGALRCW